MKRRSPFQHISFGMLVGSIGIFTSRISGLIRDILFAIYWGTSEEIGAFFIAFTIPNLFRRLFGEGAFSEAMLPLFKEKLHKEGKTSAFAFVNRVLTLVTCSLIVVIALGIGLCLLLLPFLQGKVYQLTCGLLPWLLPYALFICLAGCLASILNAFQHFSVPSFAPILLNLMFILSIFWICPYLSTVKTEQIYGLAVGVLIAGILQVLVLMPVLHRFGFRFRFIFRGQSKNLAEFFRIVGPGLVGAGIYPVNIICDRLMAGYLGGDAVSALYYSERLITLPIGVFAVALSVASLPALSQFVAEGNRPAMLEALFYSLRHLLYLILPSTLVLLILGQHIVELLYHHGEFSNEGVEASTATLFFYGLGLPAFAAIRIVRNAFLSEKDSKTPVQVALFCMGLNLLLNLILIVPLMECGLALATTLSSYVNLIVLSAVLYHRLQPNRRQLHSFYYACMRILLSLSGSAGVMLLLQRSEHASGMLDRLTSFLVPALAGMMVYLGLSLIFHAKEPNELFSTIFR